MNKKQTSQRKRSGVIANFVSPGFAVSILLLALSLTSLATTALGQPSCFDQCQAQLVQCLQQAGGNPVIEGLCENQYDECIENCVS